MNGPYDELPEASLLQKNLVDDDDDDDDKNDYFYGDARTDLLNSASDKQKNALTHFNLFFNRYCKQIKIKYVTAEEIPYKGLSTVDDTQRQINIFWDKLIGAMFTYFGTDAMKSCDPTKGRLSYGTSTGYCSSIKAYFTTKFRNEPDIPVFGVDRWKDLRAKLRGAYRESNRAAGKPALFEPKASSTRKDREAMSTGCIWLGTSDAAEFWHLLNTSYHCSGRGSEVSLLQAENINAVEVNEFTTRYNVLQVDFQRQKDGPYSSVAIYPFRDSFFECFYFTLIYSILMCGCNSKYIFPSFSKAALRTTNKKSDSTVSAAWKTCFKEISTTFEELSTLINEKLGSHCNKKGSNQVMADSLSVSGLAQIFRTGWEIRGCDTLFEYICGSFAMSKQAGKTVSGWTAKAGDTIMGGLSVVLSDLTTDPMSLNMFVDAIFEADYDGIWKQEVREMSFTSMLRHYDDFVDVLKRHPYNTYDDPARHLFIGRLDKIMADLEISQETFQQWKIEAKKAFNQKNLPALPIERICNGHTETPTFKDIAMDPRCFIDHFNTLATTFLCLEAKMWNQATNLQDVKRQNAKLIDQQGQLVDIVNHQQRLLEKISSRLHISSRAEVKGTPKTFLTLPFSVASRSLSTRAGIAEVTVGWFMDNYILGFAEEKKSAAWKKQDDRERRSIRNKFNSIRRAVRMMLMHFPNYPRMNGDPKQIRQTITSLSKDAEEQIRTKFGFGTKIITIYKLEANSMMKEHERSMKLPEDTPDAMKKFFSLS